MFSVPVLTNAEGLLVEMTRVIKSLESGSFFSWLLKSRFLELCKVSSKYLFTNDQRSAYANLVNRYKIIIAGDVISNDSNVLDKPLISDL